MKQISVYEVGDKVLIRGAIEAVRVEGGTHKYQCRDIKSNNRIDTWFTAEEITPLVEQEGEKENGEN